MTFPVSEKEKNNFIKTFRSVEDIKSHDCEIAALDSFNDKLAQQILLFLKTKKTQTALQTNLMCAVF